MSCVLYFFLLLLFFILFRLSFYHFVHCESSILYPELAIYRQSIYANKIILELCFESQSEKENGKGRNVRTVIVSRINVSGDSDILILVRVILFWLLSSAFDTLSWYWIQFISILKSNVYALILIFFFFSASCWL